MTNEIQYPYTFEEIGAALGIGTRATWMLYRSAMKKIRARPASLRALQLAVAEQQAQRSRRRAMPTRYWARKED